MEQQAEAVGEAAGAGVDLEQPVDGDLPSDRLAGIDAAVERPAEALGRVHSNPLSNLDIIVLGSQLPCVFVAKAEIDGWPAFGAMGRSVETIFIDRRARRALHTVLAKIDRALAAGQAIVIFAERTSGAGDRVMLPAILRPSSESS